MFLERLSFQGEKVNMRLNEPFITNRTIYAPKILKNLREAFTASIHLSNLNPELNGFQTVLILGEQRKILWKGLLGNINPKMKTSIKLRRVGTKATAFLYFSRHRLKRIGPDGIFIDLTYKRNRFGLGNFILIDRLLLEIYRNTHNGYTLYLLMPPSISLNKAVHKTLVEEHYKSILYANGWEVKKIIQYVDRHQYLVDARNKNHHRYKSLPSMVSHIIIANKDRTYYIDCLHSHDRGEFLSISRKLERYFSKIAGKENVKYLYKWGTFRKYMDFVIKTKLSERDRGKEETWL